MNSTLTLKLNTAGTKTVASTTASTAARIGRALACKWDMFAVVGLMASSAVYGVYALTQMTGF